MRGRRSIIARGRRNRMHGGGVWDWIKSAHNFIKSNKVISRVGSALGSVGVPYAGTIGKVAGLVGYGRFTGRPRLIGRPRKSYRVRHVKVRTRKGSRRA